MTVTTACSLGKHALCDGTANMEDDSTKPERLVTCTCPCHARGWRETGDGLGNLVRTRSDGVNLRIRPVEVSGLIVLYDVKAKGRTIGTRTNLPDAKKLADGWGR